MKMKPRKDERSSKKGHKSGEREGKGASKEDDGKRKKPE